MRKKIATTEPVKIIIVAQRGDTRVNILQVRPESSKDNRLFFFIACQTLDFVFVYFMLFFRYYL